MRHVIKLALVAGLGALLLYLSRFWIFTLWDRPGLFDLKALPPKGGLVARWLQGTDFAPMELIIWAILGFLALTLVQKIFDWTSR